VQREAGTGAAAYCRRRDIFIQELGFAIARLKKLLEERKTAGERDCEDIFQECAAPFQPLLDRIFFRFLGGDHRADIFHEVDSAFFALYPGALFIAASRALKTHRHVAMLAEARDFAYGRATFWAGNCCLGNCRGCGIPRVRRACCVCSNVTPGHHGLRVGSQCWRLPYSLVGTWRKLGGLRRRARFYLGNAAWRFTAVLPRR
jgi:hypothetical protein